MKWVYKILPAFVIHSDRLVPKGFSAWTIAMFIFIKPIKSNDKGIMAHELMHVKQFYRTFGLYMLLRVFSQSYRLEYEVEAYKEQLKYSPKDTLIFAGFISTKYDLDITLAEALAKLIEDVNV